MTQLQRKLTLYGLTMIAVGSCIGSGIFVTPYEIVRAVPHHGYALLVWTLGGLIALTGALTFAELGGMFPQSGGVYVFIKEAFGKLAGFLYGWVILLVIPIGVLQNDPEAGETAEIMVIGMSKIEAGEALNERDTIGTAADGQAEIVTAGTDNTQYIVGQVVTPAGAGEVGSAFINCASPARGA